MLNDLICFSHLRWGFVYQRPNHLMTRCARNRRVYFVEEPLFDAGHARLAIEWKLPRLAIVTPHLPPATPAEAIGIQQGQLLQDLARRHHIQRPIAWFYTPMALSFANRIPAGFTVYDCMDELAAFRGAPPELVSFEEELFRRVDLVFTGGHSLFEAKRARHPNVHAFPSSVDAAHFGRARLGNSPEPADQSAISGPKLGFFGVIDERLDLELIAQIAKERPDWQLILIGPIVKIDPSSLPRMPNIHHLGMKDYAELPDYIAHWDVALMPFARNEATRFISPTKTLEYLAAGKPVVSTPIRDVVAPYGQIGLVDVSEGEGFIAAIDRALRARGAPEASARARAADAWIAGNSWDATWGAMEELIQAGIEQARVA